MLKGTTILSRQKHVDANTDTIASQFVGTHGNYSPAVEMELDQIFGNLADDADDIPEADMAVYAEIRSAKQAAAVPEYVDEETSNKGIEDDEAIDFNEPLTVDEEAELAADIRGAVARRPWEVPTIFSDVD